MERCELCGCVENLKERDAFRMSFRFCEACGKDRRQECDDLLIRRMSFYRSVNEAKPIIFLSMEMA